MSAGVASVRFVAVLLTVGAPAGCGSSEPPSEAPAQMPGTSRDAMMDAVYVIPAQTPAEARAALAFSDPDAWDVELVDGDVMLVLEGGTRYQPPVRSPHSIALIDAPAFADFVLDVDVQQTGEAGAHQDLCLFFGHTAPDRYYYVHLAPAADPHAHNVFLVDGAERRGFATRTTKGIEWGGPERWHHVRIVRRSPSIRVYFDDAELPVMEADDATFEIGRIGFGSFDNEGRFRGITIQGDPRPAPRGPMFAR